MLLDTIKQSLQPQSITPQLVLTAIGVLLLFGGATLARAGRRWLTVLVIGYWTLSCPASVNLLARTLSNGYRPIASAEEVPGIQAVVMLGAGSRTVQASGQRLPIVTYPTALRALETARLYKMYGDPLVIVSGGVTDTNTPMAVAEAEAMKIAIVALGVPPARIVLETESGNTHDEAVVVQRMLTERRLERFAIVTTPLHMRRSLAAFAAQGLHPVGSASPLYSDRVREPFPLMPNATAMEIGNSVVYEWAALGYYWWRGWL